MVILAVDPEKTALDSLVRAIRKASPGAELHAFQDGEEAFAFAAKTPCSVIFLEPRLRDGSGLELAKRFRQNDSRANLIFTAGSSRALRGAFELHASGYLMKPVTAEKVRRELADLRYPVGPVPSGPNLSRYFFRSL